MCCRSGSRIYGQSVTIAVIEDSNLAHTSDWYDFRSVFGLKGFKYGTFKQIYPGCKDPGQNGDEIEAALDVEWASASAPTRTSCFPRAAMHTAYPGWIWPSSSARSRTARHTSDSYGLCETISGQTEVALENREAQIATALGTPLHCGGRCWRRPVRSRREHSLFVACINSGDNTASAMRSMWAAPISWPSTSGRLQHSHQRILEREEQPRNESVRAVVYSGDSVERRLHQRAVLQRSGLRRLHAIVWSKRLLQHEIRQTVRLCGRWQWRTEHLLHGVPSIPGVVSGTCKGNPKPSWQTGVPGIPNDGLRDQPDLALFASDGFWGSFLVECMSTRSRTALPAMH